jgi:Spy/CpxP family protein refolding chaperone
MTVTRLGLMTAFTMVAAMVAPAMAQNAGTTNMEILRQKVKADKKLLVAQNLNLTDEEAAAFWPVYDAYQIDLHEINQRMAAAINAYADAYNAGPVSNDAAKKLLDEALAIDEAELQMKKAAVPKVLAALPAMKAARYIQIESKIRALLRYELAASIPLVE